MIKCKEKPLVKVEIDKIQNRLSNLVICQELFEKDFDKKG